MQTNQDSVADEFAYGRGMRRRKNLSYHDQYGDDPKDSLLHAHAQRFLLTSSRAV